MGNSEGKEDKEIKDVRNWIWITTILISISLALFALIWQEGPIHGKITITFLIFLSFPLLINSITANSKAYKIGLSDNPDKDKIKAMMIIAEYSYSFGFTLILSGLAILGYEYLMDYTGRDLIALWFPVFFLSLTWFLMISYTIIDFKYDRRKNSEEKKKTFFVKILKKSISILGELIFLYLIFLDYSTNFILL